MNTLTKVRLLKSITTWIAIVLSLLVIGSTIGAVELEGQDVGQSIVSIIYLILGAYASFMATHILSDYERKLKRK